MKKKVIPVFAAIVLIIIVLLFILLGKFIEKYTPSKERMELSDYYQLSSDEEVAVIINNEVLDIKGRIINGTVYLSYQTVHDLLNSRFYLDTNENKLLYTTATDLVSADAESTTYSVTKETRSLDHPILKLDASEAYVAIDFVKLYTDLSYEVYQDPNRLVITNVWGEYSAASVKKKTELRCLGGIKSEILADLEKGTTLAVLTPDETWTKVATDDGIIGYVKSKALGTATVETHTSDFIPETFTHIQKEFPISLAWHQVTNTSANGNIGSVLQNTKGINVISPTWFYLTDNNGSIGSLASTDYVNYCHQNGIEVWALVSNFGARDQGLENPDLTEILTYTSRRENLINNLISAAIQYNLDGINIDFESVDPAVGDAYIQFIREMSLKCANNGVVLSVDNYAPTDYTAFYNRAEQAVFADYIILMAYDEHYSGSEEAGSVASIGFVSDGVANTLREVPAGQLILGMPFYTRVWSETPTTEAEDSDTIDYELGCYSAGMKDVQNLISVNGAIPVWNEETGQYYAEYVNSGATYRIWIEDTASLEEKLKVMQSSQLAGGAFWKLGLEDSSVWDTIIKYIN
ncbi:MAG: glycosyl hydrolase family 18 [Roseburia sp.]|jgi:spore germination protein YaaH|nr:glycosyl hydrolase family 18 [Roseburia sp.]